MPTILVVEDEILLRTVIAEYLRECGYRVLEALDGEEARALLRAPEPIRLVFSDVNMPGMDGITLGRWIDREYPDVKLVLASGDPRNAAAAARLGAFLQKPYELDFVGALIKRVLEGGPSPEKA